MSETIYPLYTAVEQGDVSAVRALLDAGVDPDQGYRTPTRVVPPLIRAIELEYMDIVKILVQHADMTIPKQVFDGTLRLETPLEAARKVSGVIHDVIVKTSK